MKTFIGLCVTDWWTLGFSNDNEQEVVLSDLYRSRPPPNRLLNRRRPSTKSRNASVRFTNLLRRFFVAIGHVTTGFEINS